MKHWLLAISLMLLGGSMSACSGGSAKWKEEVQLSDGRIIVVERETFRDRGGDEWASNRSGSKPKEYRIWFSYPDGSGKVVEWRSIKETETWPEVPLILDVQEGRPIVFSSVSTSGGGHIYSKYVYQNSAWIEEQLPETFPRRAKNLLIFDPVDMPEFVNLKTKHEFDDDNMRAVGMRGYAHVGPTRVRRADRTD